MLRLPHRVGQSAGHLVRILVGGGLGLLLVNAPPVREALIAIEPTIAPALFIVAIIGAGRVWVMRRRQDSAGLRRARRTEAIAGRALARWGWIPALAIFVAPIWSHWAQRPPDPLVEFSALLGRIPWGDAHGHIEGGLRLLGADRFGAYSERRPLHAAWLAVRLWLFDGDMGKALILQALVLGLAAFLLARSVGRRHGLWSGIACLALLQSFARGAVPCVVTEPLGMTLAAVGVTVLFSDRARSSLAFLAVGLFLLDAALAARPGPQFLTPAIALWAVLGARHAWRRTAIVLVVALALSGLATRALNGLYGAGEADFVTYPAFTLYGLTHGSNYRQVRADLGDDLSRYGSERDLARLLYQRSLDRLRERPFDLVATLLSNEGKFFAKLPYNLSQTTTLRHFLVAGPQMAEETVGHEALDMATALPFLGLAALGGVFYVGRRADIRTRWLWIAAALGILASVPFVYGDAGFRGLASAYPLLCVFLAIGLTSAHRVPSHDAARHERGDLVAAASLGLVLLGVSLVVPALARRSWPRPQPASLRGLRPGHEVVLSLSTSPKVLVARFPRAGLADVPFVERDAADRLLRLSQASIAETLARRRGAFVVLSAFDFVSQRQQIVVAKPDILRINAPFVRAAGHLVHDGDVFEATQSAPLGR
jgi:hypothetical protein